MKLTTLTISNFQCFGADATPFALDDVTYLLGPNGAGKTAALHALARIFAVDPALRGIRLSDFHVPTTSAVVAATAESARVGVEGLPDPTTEGCAGSEAQHHEADDAGPLGTPSIRRFGSEDGSAELWIEVEFALPEAGDSDSGPHPAIPEFLFQMRLEAVDGPMRVRMRLTATIDDEDEIEERLEFVLARDAEGEPTKLQPVPNYARRRIQLHYLPARRNPHEQISYAPATLLGNALRAANWQTENLKIQAWNKEISEALAENKAITAIGKQLTHNWGRLHRGSYYSSPTIGFGQSDLDLLLRQLTVNFAPNPQGAATSYDMLSDGQQSLLYLTTVLAMHQVGRSLLTDSPEAFSEERFRPAVFTLLAFEEPENSLSPFYLGRVLKLLKASAAESDCQAVIATHSPAVVRRVDPGHVRYLRLDESRVTRVRPIKLPPNEDEAHKYIKQAVAAYPELYFARMVVLGEGASEEVFLPRLFSASGAEVDENSVAVVPLGGRHVNHMWRLLNGLDIPHLTLLDLDRCRFGGGWGRVRTAVANLREFSSRPETQQRVQDVQPSDLPSWTNTDLPTADAKDSWLSTLEAAGVFFADPLDLDLLLLEHYPDAYPSEEDAPEGDSAVDSNEQSAAQPVAATDPTADVLAAQVLGKKGLAPTGSYSAEQIALFPRYRALFQLNSKPAAHLVALSRLTDEQLLSDLPPVMQRLVTHATQLLDAHGE